MAWLEMSRSPDERPIGWRVGECLWSPRKKSDGASWGFWETILAVKRGDVVFHLCGDSGDATFTGFSVADEDGQPVDYGPSGPEELYRVHLRDFTRFEAPLVWKSIRIEKYAELLAYFQANRNRERLKERLFYVYQSGRLQCLNGAYLSNLSDPLAQILFGFKSYMTAAEVVVETSAPAGTVLTTAAVRIGQQKFSENVKANFSRECCFPGCPVSDSRFLIGAHIARWADVTELRGRTENGLCLCVLHDRAFEVGAFTFDRDLRVKLHGCDPTLEWVQQLLCGGAGKPIKASTIPPTQEMLIHHWKRHRINMP
jgi:putative restriction endonuclease